MTDNPEEILFGQAERIKQQITGAIARQPVAPSSIALLYLLADLQQHIANVEISMLNSGRSIENSMLIPVKESLENLIILNNQFTKKIEETRDATRSVQT